MFIVPHVEEKVERKEYAPKFNPPLDDWHDCEGKSIRLECRVDALPRANVSWYKDGLPVRQDDRHSLDYDEGGKCSLVILDAKEKDQGAYRLE